MYVDLTLGYVLFVLSLQAVDCHFILVAELFSLLLFCIMSNPVLFPYFHQLTVIRQAIRMGVLHFCFCNE